LLFIYLIGTIPVGVLVAKARGIDITSVGSGNVGATNVARSVGKKAGIVTLIGDALKGAIGTVLGELLFPTEWGGAVAAFFVVAGHCFSLPPVLKGGKGVATALGAIVYLFPFGALIGVVAFALVFATSKIVSLSSIVAAVAIPVSALVSGAKDSTVSALIAVSLLVIYRHHANIDRLMKGTEPTFSTKK
jgi:glycerol-3-phosphate acyltransferase PlsY